MNSQLHSGTKLPEVTLVNSAFQTRVQRHRPDEEGGVEADEPVLQLRKGLRLLRPERDDVLQQGVVILKCDVDYAGNQTA